jgi:predicted Zn finger-like uncharacterized protein
MINTEIIMHTQCPHCQTIFNVTAAHLNIAQGHVRCSHCRNIFNATNSLLKELPGEEGSEKFEVNAEQNTPFQDEDIPELLQEDIYDPPRGRSWKSFFLWSLIVIMLAGLLTAQFMWFFKRDDVLQHAQIRPWLDLFCYHFLCTLPPTRDVKLFQIEHHVVQIHPEWPDTIQVEATFINKAIFPQPYPELQLIFEDYNGQILEERRFTAAEYLQKDLTAEQELGSQSTVHLKLELKDMNAVIEENQIPESYRFEFL